MTQILLGILLGIGALILLVALGALIYVVRAATIALDKATATFKGSAEMSAAVTASVLVQKRMISSLETMTAAIKVFNGHVFAEPLQAVAPEARGWRNTTPPPPNPVFEHYAPEEEAGVMHQTDEERAEIEAEEDADPLHVHHMPSEEEINFGAAV